MKNIYQFRLLDELKPSDTEVRISDVIWWSDEVWNPKKANFVNETVVLTSEDGIVWEITFASASEGKLTFSKRGINETGEEETFLKKTRWRGTKAYITARSSDFVDKNEKQIWEWKQIYNNWVEIHELLNAENILATGTVEAQKWFKIPTFNTLDEANTFFSEKFSGLQINVAGTTYIYNTEYSRRESLWIADPTPNATTDTAGIVQVATDEEYKSGAEKSWNAYLVPTTKQIKDNSQVSYFSAKRPLGEDIDCSTWPKAYFNFPYFEEKIVEGDQDWFVGKTDQSLWFFLNEDYKKVTSLELTPVLVWSPSEIKILSCKLEKTSDTTPYEIGILWYDYNRHTIHTYNDIWPWEMQVFLESRYNDQKHTLYCRLIDTNTEEELKNFNYRDVQANFIYFNNKKRNIRVEFRKDYQAYQYGKVAKIIYNKKIIVKNVSHSNWSNIILPIVWYNYIEFHTEGVSPINYWIIKKHNNKIGGKYVLWYKGIITSSWIDPMRNRVDGVLFFSWTKGQITTGIEGWIYELPTWTTLTGDLYVQSDWSLWNTQTALYFGKWLGKKIKIKWGYKINTSISDTATTGEITLGKAKWYMSIIWQDWKTYKIPVYDD